MTRVLDGERSTAAPAIALATDEPILPATVGLEGGGTVRTDDAEILEAVVISDTIDVVENQRHPVAAPAFVLPAELADALLDAFLEETILEVST